MTTEQSPAIPKKPGKLRTAGRGVVGLLGLRQFSPKALLRSDAFERGSVLRASWQLMRSTWHVPTKEECRHESFQEACRRLSLSREDVAARHRSFILASRACYGCAMATLCISIYYAAHGNAVNCLAGIVFTVVGTWCGLSRAFRAWQIDIRNFASLSSFLSTPEAWLC